MYETLPVSQARARLFELVERVSARGDTVVLTHSGEPAVVLLSHEEYERLLDCVTALGDPDGLDDLYAFPGIDAL